MDRDVIVAQDARDHSVRPAEVDDDVKARCGESADGQQLSEPRDRHVSVHPEQSDGRREDDTPVSDADPPDERADVDPPRHTATTSPVTQRGDDQPLL